MGNGRWTRWRALFVCSLIALPPISELRGQSVDAGIPLAAILISVVDCHAEGTGVEIRRSGAIIIGTRGDTAFAVTADHVVRPREGNCVVPVADLALREPSFSGEAVVLPDEDENLDLAVVGVVLTSGASWHPPMRVTGVKPDMGHVYLIGCPTGGGCAEEPLQARVRRTDSLSITVQSALIEEGYSGGPVVDRSGQLLGMTVDYGGQDARVIRWSVIEGWLRSKGYPINLPVRRIDALGHSLWAVTGSLLPLGAVDADRSRILLSASVRYEKWDDDGWASYYSVDRLSFTTHAFCSGCSDRRQFAGTVGYYVTTGLGYSRRNTAFGFAKYFPYPVSASYIACFLVGKSQQLIRRTAPDSTDYATGSPIIESYRTAWKDAIGWRAEANFTIGLSRTLGLRVAPQIVWLSVQSDETRASVRKPELYVGLTYLVAQ